MDDLFSVYGPLHRKERHHREGIEEARQLFGNNGAVAATIHILRDCRHIPGRRDYELGYVDALGLKKDWSASAYVHFSDDDFESVVLQMLKPTGLMLWAFLNPDAVRFFLSSLTQYGSEQIDQLLENWKEARQRLEGLPPFLPSLSSLERVSTEEAPGDIREYLMHLTKGPLLNALGSALGEAVVAYVPVDQLVNPLVHIDYEYLEDLKPELASSDPLDILKFAIPERITTELKAVADPTQRNITFVSNQKGITASPVRVRSTPEGTEVTFVITANASAILVSEVGGRLLLRNGIHRAYLLAQMGLARVPCIFVRDPAPVPTILTIAYPAFTIPTLMQVRPPMLVDLLKPELCLQVPLVRTHKIIRISAEETIVPVS